MDDVGIVKTDVDEISANSESEMVGDWESEAKQKSSMIYAQETQAGDFAATVWTIWRAFLVGLRMLMSSS